jgi:hypothetical protein
MAPGPGWTLSWCAVLHGMNPPLPPVRRSPVLGAIHENARQTGLEQVQHRDDRADHDANDEHHSDEQNQQLGSRIDIPTEMPMPPTVLVTELHNGTLILQGRPDGPRVWLEPDEALPLRRALARAFGSPDLVSSSGQGEAP